MVTKQIKKQTKPLKTRLGGTRWPELEYLQIYKNSGGFGYFFPQTVSLCSSSAYPGAYKDLLASATGVLGLKEYTHHHHMAWFGF